MAEPQKPVENQSENSNLNHQDLNLHSNDSKDNESVTKISIPQFQLHIDHHDHQQSQVTAATSVVDQSIESMKNNSEDSVLKESNIGGENKPDIIGNLLHALEFDPMMLKSTSSGMIQSSIPSILPHSESNSIMPITVLEEIDVSNTLSLPVDLLSKDQNVTLPHAQSAPITAISNLLEMKNIKISDTLPSLPIALIKDNSTALTSPIKPRTLVPTRSCIKLPLPANSSLSTLKKSVQFNDNNIIITLPYVPKRGRYAADSDDSDSSDDEDDSDDDEDDEEEDEENSEDDGESEESEGEDAKLKEGEDEKIKKNDNVQTDNEIESSAKQEIKPASTTVTVNISANANSAAVVSSSTPNTDSKPESQNLLSNKGIVEKTMFELSSTKGKDLSVYHEILSKMLEARNTYFAVIS